MSPVRLSLLAAALVFAARSCDAAEPVPLTAALENTPALGAPGALSDAPNTETAAPVAPPAEPPGNPLWAIPLRALSATRERPLFSPSRRPPAPIVVSEPAPVAPRMPPVVKPPPPEPPPLNLVGTVVGAGKRVAILFNRMTRQVTQVPEGQEESGWRVRSVSPRSAVVEKDERSVTLDLPNPGDETATAGMAGAGGDPGAPGLLGAGGVPTGTPMLPVDGAPQPLPRMVR